MRRVNAVLSKLVTSPSEGLALDLDLTKKQRRVSTDSLDDLFDLWIRAATSHFEEQTGRAVMRGTYEYRLDCFPPLCDRFIEIPKAPLVEVLTIEFDSDGSPSVDVFNSDSYDVIAPTGDHCAPGRIVLKSGATWPTTTAVGGAVRILFTAGYADEAADVPALIQSALFFLVGHFHKYGEEVIGGPEANSLMKIPLGAATLIEAFKYSALPTQRPWEVPWRD